MDLISAIATPAGRGGVAIVRMSGEGALSAAKKMFSRKGDFVPNMMYAGRIEADGFGDFGMCVYFRAPHSFTGEDTVEFHCHGGEQIVRGVLARTLSLGARLAEKGEFTRRAFLNGKLSLSAAEGMADMIEAQSRSEVRAGFALYREKLTREAERIQKMIKTALASVNADVDFPEEDLTRSTREEIALPLGEAKKALEELLAQYRAGRKIKNGVRVALCGKPNAGKSTLFNALVGYDRAIVSSEAGTTRDLIEGSIEINGVLFLLTDTAGIREGESPIEREGVRRARKAIESADLIVYLKEDEAFAFPEGTPVITVGAKSDLTKKTGCDVCVSAVTGEGIGELKRLMFERGYGEQNFEPYLLEERHRTAVSQALEAVNGALEAVTAQLPAELYAADLSRAYLSLGAISGECASEEIVSEIFSKFCVGK